MSDFWSELLSTSILHAQKRRLALAFAGRLCDIVPQFHELAHIFIDLKVKVTVHCVPTVPDRTSL